MHHLSALLSCHCDVHFTRGPYYRCLTCSGSHRPRGTVRFESRRSDSRVHSLDHLAILQPYDLDYPSDFSRILSSLTTSWQCHLLHYSFKYCLFRDFHNYDSSSLQLPVSERQVSCLLDFAHGAPVSTLRSAHPK